VKNPKSAFKKGTYKRVESDKWLLEDKNTLLGLHMMGWSVEEIIKKAIFRTKNFLREHGGVEKIIHKMQTQYGTIPIENRIQALLRIRIGKRKEKNRMPWAIDTHWVCPFCREGHKITENEIRWVRFRFHNGHKTALFSGMSWERCSEETGRSIEECKRLFSKYIPETLF